MIQIKTAHQDLRIFALRKNTPWTASPKPTHVGQQWYPECDLGQRGGERLKQEKDQEELELIHF